MKFVWAEFANELRSSAPRLHTYGDLVPAFILRHVSWLLLGFRLIVTFVT